LLFKEKLKTKKQKSYQKNKGGIKKMIPPLLKL